jgi:hypothetical protein
MPVDLQWHPTLPVLIATYRGVITPGDYRTMCDRRRAMLEAGPEQVILLADTREMEALREDIAAMPCENTVARRKVYRTLIVLHERLYRTLIRAIADTSDQDTLVSFYRDREDAIRRAERLAAQLG